MVGPKAVEMESLKVVWMVEYWVGKMAEALAEKRVGLRANSMAELTVQKLVEWWETLMVASLGCCLVEWMVEYSGHQLAEWLDE